MDLLDTDEFEGLVVDLPDGGLFPSIYNGRQPIWREDTSSRPVTYGLAVQLEALPPELHDQVMWHTPRFGDESIRYLSCYGALRPEVVPTLPELRRLEDSGGYDTKYMASWHRTAESKLVELLGRLGARNLSTDRLFVGRHLRVELRGSRMDPMDRRMPYSVREAIAGKFKLVPTKVWVYLEEDE